MYFSIRSLNTRTLPVYLANRSSREQFITQFDTESFSGYECSSFYTKTTQRIQKLVSFYFGRGEIRAFPQKINIFRIYHKLNLNRSFTIDSQLMCVSSKYIKINVIMIIIVVLYFY